MYVVKVAHRADLGWGLVYFANNTEIVAVRQQLLYKT
jgi:hypothetical protein